MHPGRGQLRSTRCLAPVLQGARCRPQACTPQTETGRRDALRALSFVSLKILCYNLAIMVKRTNDDMTTQTPISPQPVETVDEASPAERRAQRWFIGGALLAALLLIGLIVLMVFLSIDAYQAASAGEAPSPGSVVVGLLRDTAIVFVAFESLLIGILMIILVIQVQSLIVLLRDEIRPMLEAANETMTTVRGTTKFVSHNVVSPVVRWSGYMAGVRRIVREVSGLTRKDEET